MIDADYFKAYNDRYGHLEGDKCLQSVGKSIKDVLHRPMDVVARFGGEEFIAMTYGVRQEDATTIADRIRSAVENLKIPLAEGGEARITVSIGIASVQPISGEVTSEIAKALKQADTALYSAKSAGRNRFVVIKLSSEKLESQI
jgi:diguanylate cyclase (GGDEF)-like protein